MGWLKRILQGSTSKSRRRSNGSCEVEDRRSCSDEPSDVEDESTEREETDYQIARIHSFSEDGQAYNPYGATSTEDWVRYAELKWDDEDERPAQSFQQSLAFESSSLWDIANIFQPFPYPFYPDDGQAFLHPECVHSYASHDSLTGRHEVFVSEDHSIYHNIDIDHHLNRRHHHHHPRPICFVCGQPIPVDENGRLLVHQHPFWPQKCCISHERDGTPRCCGCNRLEPRGSMYSPLGDGRWLCPECRESAVMDGRALKPLERSVREFYERLGMKIHQRTIPLLLVSKIEMKEDEARCQMKGQHRPNQTVGLTTSESLPICTTVEGKDHVLVAHSRIETMEVQKGFPSLATGQTLAHEMMHAWLRLEGYHGLDKVVEEGLCEVLGNMWLDSHMRSLSKSKIALSPGFDFQKRLAEFLQDDVESNPDPVYGGGYRLMRRATDMHGLKGILDYIRMTGSYP